MTQKRKLVILIALTVLLSITVLSFNRPTNEYLVIYGDREERIIEADSFEDAYQIFKKEQSGEIIHSVARRSYVQSRWIWPIK